ncbi:hypothetical protein ACLMJK_006212 [Lecanora helva]
MSFRKTSPTASSRVPLDRNDPSFSTPTTPIPRSLTKSTPRALTVKPPPFRSRAKNQTEDDISIQPLSQPDDQIHDTSDDPFFTPASEPCQPSPSPRLHLENLPPEILECIVGYVVGHLGATMSDSSGYSHNIRNWNAVMRHPRRKKVADLALVSPTWRRLIQERIYRHIKVQGTRAALDGCVKWFLHFPHLQDYVRHFEVLVPIWEMKPNISYPKFSAEQHSGSGGHTLLRSFQSLAIGINRNGDVHDPGNVFRLASKNATIDEIFLCAQILFPCLCALTIEGGHCKRPPKVQYFRESAHQHTSTRNHRKSGDLQFDTAELEKQEPQQHPCNPSYTYSCLPILPRLKTLILKGAWNIIRAPTDFATLTRALPSLQEFHCTFHKPKTLAYATMCDCLVENSAATITHLNLCLEGLYSKNASSLKKWRKLYPARHICRSLGALTPRLESLTYTGRVCGTLFSAAVGAAERNCRDCPRLKSIDIVVNNVCRDPNTFNDGIGIHNWSFIQAFEALVIQAVRSLQVYSGVQSMRIRFIDLDSPAPLMNPMFHLEGDRAWGLYSDEIFWQLTTSRPNVRYPQRAANFGFDGHLDSHDYSKPYCDLRSNHRVISVGYYKVMAQAGGLT